MTRARFDTPEAAEAAFYDALERADVEGMMEVWSPDEEIVCVHPGGSRLVGRIEVREGWRQIFLNGTRLRFRIDGVEQLRAATVSVHNVIEHIAIEGDPRAIDPVLATNAYVLSDNGWHLWLHHAGALPAVVAADDPETQTPTLH